MKPLMQYILLIITATFFSCKENPPVVPPVDDTVANTITLKVEWTDLYRINVKWNKAKADTLEPFTYCLIQTDEQGNKTTKEFIITGKDTSHTAGEPDSLQQGKTYWFNVEAYNSEVKLKDTSKTVEGKTLTPTSHDIVWQIDTLGQPGNFLYDVWGLDENNVYAVGYVTLNGTNYNIIKWNGTNWQPHSLVEGALTSIYGFSNNNMIVVGSYGSYGFAAKWDGIGWNETNFFRYFPDGDTVWALRSVWGSSPEDVWAVGDQGTIIHWDGVEWNKIYNPTNKNLVGIWGTSSNNIYALTGSFINDSELLQYDGTNWKIITEQIPPDRRQFNSIWLDKSNIGYIVGTNVLYYNGIIWSRQNVNQSYFALAVNGSGSNNVFIVGQNFQVLHFNGTDWIRYTELEDNTPSSRLSGVKVFTNKVFLAGYNSNNVIIFRGEIK